MDLPYMRVEWKCSTMVYGVQCVIMDGIYLMHKFYAINWGLEKHLLLYEIHPMDRVPDRIGLLICIVLVLSKLLNTVQIIGGVMVIIVVVVI